MFEAILGVGLALFLLVGGAVGTYFGQRHLSKAQYRKEIMRLATEAASKDYESNKDSPAVSRIPISASLTFYYTFLFEIDNGSAPKKAAEVSLQEMERVI